MNDESLQYVYRMMRKKFQWTAIALKTFQYLSEFGQISFPLRLLTLNSFLTSATFKKKCEIIFPTCFCVDDVARGKTVYGNGKT